MPPGKHTDGQIYLWISDGYPQSAMPAWKQRLNAQEMWQLVIYLRTFGRATPTPPTDALGATAQPQTAPTSADLWSVHTDGTGLRRLTKINEDTPMAVCSPDGSTIALMGAGGMYLMSADGGDLRRIDALGDHGGLDWAR